MNVIIRLLYYYFIPMEKKEKKSEFIWNIDKPFEWYHWKEIWISLFWLEACEDLWFEIIENILHEVWINQWTTMRELIMSDGIERARNTVETLRRMKSWYNIMTMLNECWLWPKQYQ